MKKNNFLRILIGTLCVIGLVSVYLFQNYKVATGLDSSFTIFVINRTLRFFLNDLFTIGLIYALFEKRKYIVFSLYVQLAGVILFLIPYFILKFYLPGYNGPMINYLHRLILNPTLLLLLIIAFYYQRKRTGEA